MSFISIIELIKNACNGYDFCLHCVLKAWSHEAISYLESTGFSVSGATPAKKPEDSVCEIES